MEKNKIKHTHVEHGALHSHLGIPMGKYMPLHELHGAAKLDGPEDSNEPSQSDEVENEK